jgi:alpha-galactosidase
VIDLKRSARRFTAAVGVDDAMGKNGSVEFRVLGDGQLLWTSGVVRGGEQAKPIDVDLTGVSILQLLASDGGDGNAQDHSDWADAQLEMIGDQRPEAIDPATITN